MKKKGKLFLRAKCQLIEEMTEIEKSLFGKLHNCFRKESSKDAKIIESKFDEKQDIYINLKYFPTRY